MFVVMPEGTAEGTTEGMRGMMADSRSTSQPTTMLGEDRASVRHGDIVGGTTPTIGAVAVDPRLSAEVMELVEQAEQADDPRLRRMAAVVRNGWASLRTRSGSPSDHRTYVDLGRVIAAAVASAARASATPITVSLPAEPTPVLVDQDATASAVETLVVLVAASSSAQQVRVRLTAPEASDDVTAPVRTQLHVVGPDAQLSASSAARVLGAFIRAYPAVAADATMRVSRDGVQLRAGSFSMRSDSSGTTATCSWPLDLG